jgi:hypothetical protein
MVLIPSLVLYNAVDMVNIRLDSCGSGGGGGGGDGDGGV